MRVVLDTNVLLSAMFTRGVCEAVLDACMDSETCAMVLSEYILGEFEAVAVNKFGAPIADAKAARDFLRRHAEIVVTAGMPADACPDPDDLAVLGTAVAGGADALVTGDAELLAMVNVRGTPILSPRAFYDRVR